MRHREKSMKLLMQETHGKGGEVARAGDRKKPMKSLTQETQGKASEVAHAGDTWKSR